MPTPTWPHLKPHLDRLEHAALVDLLRDLYALNADNRTFLAARFLAKTPEALVAPYRRIVRQVFNPSRGAPSLELGAATKALHDFRKLCADPHQIIDFMLFYVEQGVICTNTYGDIDAPFYDGLLSVYQDAAELANNTGDTAVIEHFRPRFARVVHDTAQIGWGFHDDLTAVYYERLPPKDETT